jgi:nucleoid-associated protein EbfC
MFKNLTGFAQLLRTATSLAPRIQEMKERLGQERAQGSAADGAVAVELTGLGEVLSVKLAPELMQPEGQARLEELIPAAMNEALAKVRKLHIEMLREATGGVDLPGLDDVLGSL